MERRITIEWYKKYSTITGGLYRLWVGDKYYIGRSRMLTRRFREHGKSINIRLRSGHQLHPLDYYQKVIKHILAKKKIKTLYIEILSVATDDKTLIRLEQRWFNKCKKDSKCLNFGFIADRSKITK